MKHNTQTRLNRHNIIADDTLPARPADAPRLVKWSFKAWQERRRKEGTLSTELPPIRRSK